MHELRAAVLGWRDEQEQRGLTLSDDQPPDSERLPPYYWAAFTLSGDWR